MQEKSQNERARERERASERETWCSKEGAVRWWISKPEREREREREREIDEGREGESELERERERATEREKKIERECVPGVVKKELCEGTLQDLHARFHIVERAHNLEVYGVDMQLPTACYNLTLP